MNNNLRKPFSDISCHGDQIQSLCWHGNSTLIATTCKDKKLRVLDPRASSVAQVCSLLLHVQNFCLTHLSQMVKGYLVVIFMLIKF